MKEIRIEKRNGEYETLDLEKIHKVLTWACENIKGVSVSEIELRSQLQFFDKMKSKDIHETLTKTAADLISEETPNYQYVASRLINFNLRKEVYGRFEPMHLKTTVTKNIDLGYYTPELMEWYTDEEWDRLNRVVKHDRDYDIVYAGMSQFTGKYLVQNRVTKEYYETPQVAYMLIAASLFHKYPKDIRMKYVKDYYDAISTFDISVPTPILAGVRTPVKQFSSCVLIDCDDSLDSINQTTSAIVNYVSRKAGIGLNAGRLRGLGSEIRNGEVKHTGVIPFLKYFQSALKSCSQGGVRGGAATVYFPFWHIEIESIVVLKNNKGVEENRVRHMDYGIQFCELFYKRLLAKDKITLFSPDEVPDMMEAFYRGDNAEFERLYVKYEKSRSVKMKKTVSAFDFVQMYIDERVNTGRIYLQNIDHSNTHSAFDQALHPVVMSNLCTEIQLPTRPLGSVKKYEERVKLGGEINFLEKMRRDDRYVSYKVLDLAPDSDYRTFEVTENAGRIALCTLSAINWGNIKSPADFEKPCELAVRALDALLSYQDYPQAEARLSTEEFRTLGVGVINLAYFLAKNNAKYDESAFELVDEYMEAMTYYLIKASNKLAQEFGPCKLSHETKYGQGIVPYETRKKDVDKLVKNTQRLDWKQLKKDLKQHGIRNATLTALMPCESSSQLSNATNGVEPPRGFVSEKASKDGVLKQVVPEFHRLKNKYDLLWDQKSPEGYLKIMCILQKWTDQTISANTSYNPLNYINTKIPLEELVKHLVLFYKYGGHNLYYSNTYDGASDEIEDKDESLPQLPSSMDDDDDDCEACKL